MKLSVGQIRADDWILIGSMPPMGLLDLIVSGKEVYIQYAKSGLPFSSGNCISLLLFAENLLSPIPIYILISVIAGWITVFIVTLHLCKRRLMAVALIAEKFVYRLSPPVKPDMHTCSCLPAFGRQMCWNWKLSDRMVRAFVTGHGLCVMPMSIWSVKCLPF